MPDISVLIKPASGICNLQCKYCFYHDETKTGKWNPMVLCRKKLWIFRIRHVPLLIREESLPKTILAMAGVDVGDAMIGRCERGYGRRFTWMDRKSRREKAGNH